jgi:D-amino peptidase
MVAVKRGLSRFSARNIAPKRARQMIEDGARMALENLDGLTPYVPAKPTTLIIDLGAVDHAAQYRGRQNVEIIDDLQVISKGEDWMTAWNQIWHW